MHKNNEVLELLICCLHY